MIAQDLEQELRGTVEQRIDAGVPLEKVEAEIGLIERDPEKQAVLREWAWAWKESRRKVVFVPAK